MQCGMNLITPKADDLNRTLQVAVNKDFPTNKGGLCTKGWTATDLLNHPERLTTPLIRETREDAFRPATWDEAYSRIVREFAKAQASHGNDAVGVFGGGGLTNEKAYLLGKFARVALKTSMIDYNGRFCMSSAAAANNKAFGIDRGLPFPLEDIPGAETILLIGSNAAETMPPIMQYFDAQRERGGNLIVVDPRKTPTAANATLHLQITPGTDIALANGLLYIALQDGFLDHDYIAARTNGFDSVRRAVASYWPDRVERITGIPVKDLNRAARMIGESASAMAITARGAEQHSKGVNTVLAFINLMLALGKVGTPNSGYGCLTGQGNGQGGREHGQKADQLPGYRLIANSEHRAQIAKIWEISPEDLPKPGVSAYELLDIMGLENGVKALFVVGSNVAVSAPRTGHIRERLNALDFLVVSDFFLSETAELAHVVLPTTQFAEETGTMTNLEGRVLLRERATEAPEGVRSDLTILAELAERMGVKRGFSDLPEMVFEELRRATSGGIADYNGVTYEKIRANDGIFWPCPDETHPGTPRMFGETFATPDGKAKFHAVGFVPPAEEPDDLYPLYLTTGRVMQHYQSGTQTRRVKALNDLSPDAFVEIHPTLAKSFGIFDGDWVTLVTRRGEAEVRARLTPTIRQDTLFVPFHWAKKQSVNLLTNPALDPISKMPEFKVCAVRISRD